MDDSESHEPNEYGFSGDPTAPEVSTDEHRREATEDEAEEEAEDEAIPADDLTEPVSDTIADAAMDETDDEPPRRDRASVERKPGE